MLQLSGNTNHTRRRDDMRSISVSLVDLEEGEHGILDRLDLPDDIARRLMELGFLPGHEVTAARSAPGGDPRVFRVDGSEIALRRETAQCMVVRPPASEPPLG